MWLTVSQTRQPSDKSYRRPALAADPDGSLAAGARLQRVWAAALQVLQRSGLPPI